MSAHNLDPEKLFIVDGDTLCQGDKSNSGSELVETVAHVFGQDAPTRLKLFKASPLMLEALKEARELLADELSVVVEGSALIEVDEIMAAAIAEAEGGKE